mmetsp:Transcript_17074/g.28359  ORF Transcript_17074/g.28359 Transcript_17074/m.28359 type:complete len:356 (-) Transcript_17074:58-1125(-)
MPRVNRRRKSRDVVEEDDDEVEDKFIVQDDDIPSQIPVAAAATDGAASQYDDGEGMTLTQHCSPEKSQAFPVAKANERSNLENLTEEQRQKFIVDAGRLVLFKALAGESIDRLKCAKIIGFPSNASRITSAVWEQVQINLENVFGVKLVKPPQFMKLPKKYDDRFYCINAIPEDESGNHSKAIHSVHNDAAMEKGLLMVILAFCFCKGNPRPQQPTTMRWITDIDLYRLLHGLDENLPMDPPSVTQRKPSASLMSSQITIVDGMTPKVDVLMEKFVNMDYLLKDKTQSATADEDITLYAMGPRAALEIGRRQVIYFCSEILEEQPDPSMLQEVADEGGGVDDDTQMTLTMATATQ